MFDDLIDLLNEWIREKNTRSRGKKKTTLRFSGGDRDVDQLPRTNTKISGWAVDRLWLSPRKGEKEYMADDEGEAEEQDEGGESSPAPFEDGVNMQIDPALAL